MAYIISVNSNIISQSGGTCVCDYEASAAAGDGVCATDPAYMLCVQEIQRDLVTATAAISALTSFCMGLFANMPIALAPGMGLVSSYSLRQNFGSLADRDDNRTPTLLSMSSDSTALAQFPTVSP